MADEDEEWWQQFAFLSPEEQEAILADSGVSMGGTGAPFSYYGSGLSDDYALGDIANIPEYTAKGALDPFDLTQQAKRINVTQDYGALLLDNILSGMAGPGSYDIGAFTPTKEYGKEVVRKGQNRIDQYRNAGGWEGYIADKIAGGMTPSAAMAALEEFTTTSDPDDPDLDPQTAAAVKSITASLPRYRSTGPEMPGEDLGFWGDYDYDTVFGTAQDLSNAVFEDDAYGYEEVGPDGKTRYYEAPPEEIKTPQMEFFDKYGLPYPTATYDDPKYLEAMLNAEEGTDPGYRAQEAQQYLQEYQGLRADESRATSEGQRQRNLDRELLAAWETANPTQGLGPTVAPRTTRPATTTVPGSAGIDFNTQFGPGAEGAGLLPQATGRSATEAQLPTTVMQGGRRTPIPQPATPSRYAGSSNIFQRLLGTAQPEPFSFTRDPQASGPQVPMVRDVNGQTGLVGRTETRLPNMGMGFGVFKDAERVDPAFSAFSFKRGDKARPLKAKDVDRKAMAKRMADAGHRSATAYHARTDAEARDPRLNDITRGMELFLMAQNGRTPLQDAVAQRRLGTASLGL